MNNDIFGFEITMDDLVGVQFVDGLADLSHDEGSLGFRDGLQLFEVFEELSTNPSLKNDVDVGIIVKKTIHFDDVGVIEVGLDFQLAQKLFCDLLFLEQPFRDDFEGTDKFSFFFLH